MPKRRRSGSLGAAASCIANRPPSRHIYLIFDDWLWGYSIRKVDLDQPAATDDVSGEAAIDHPELEQPPPPSVLRLEAPRGLPMYFTSAFGSKIIAMHPREAPAWKSFVHVLDVSTRGFIFGPRPRFDQADPIYIPVGDMLFSLATSSFELLHPPPLCDPDDDRAVWSWRRFPSPPFESKCIPMDKLSSSALVRPPRLPPSPSTRDGYIPCHLSLLQVKIRKMTTTRGMPWRTATGLKKQLTGELRTPGGSCIASGCCRSLAVLTSTASWTPGLGFLVTRAELATSARAMRCLSARNLTT
ncbi:hypothetical protein BS78_01G088800 [Paspalum vaginatum]|nr:hypothetical protein BS78_01G088800 [Paspalum vaginatum]